MCDDLLGSYSIRSTTAFRSSLFLWKSTILYLFLCPAPLLRDVILPKLFLPPVEILPFVKDEGEYGEFVGIPPEDEEFIPDHGEYPPHKDEYNTCKTFENC